MLHSLEVIFILVSSLNFTGSVLSHLDLGKSGNFLRSVELIL